MLEKIASQFADRSSKKTLGKPRVTGAIYFYKITDRRFTSGNRVGLEIFKAICGTGFEPRMVCVTTMWDNIDKTKNADYDKLSRELRKDYMNFSPKGETVFDLKDDCNVLDVLNRFRPDPSRSLQLEREIRDLGISHFKRTAVSTKIRAMMKKGFCKIL